MRGRLAQTTAATLVLVLIGVGLATVGIPTGMRPITPTAGSDLAVEGSQPAASAFTASPNPDDAGVSATFNASGTCLALLGGCSYAYSGLPSGCSGGSGASFSCSPSSTGTFDVGVTATWGCPLCVTNNASLTFTVNAYPSVSSVTATPANIDAGESTALQATVSGGTPAISFRWTQLPSGCGSADMSSLTCTPTGTGNFTVLVGIEDSLGARSNGSVVLSVATRLTAQLSVSPTERDLGGAVTFTATISGGQPPFSERYQGLPPGCSSQETVALTCTPSSAGTFPVNLTVTDSVGGTATAQATIAVVNGPSASLTATPAALDLGESVAFVTSVTGGSGPDGFSYADLPAGCSGANRSTVDCTPTASGTFSVTVTVTDAEGETATAVASVTINPALTATFSANRTSGLAPLAVSFVASPSGGTAPFRYAWEFASNASSNLSAPSYVFVAGGTYSVSLTVTDSVGASATAFRQINVTPPSNLVTYPISIFVNPSGCGPVSLNSVLVRDGSTDPLPAATYAAVAPSCPGFSFTQWVASGAVAVNDTAAITTQVTVGGTGSITAVLTAVVTHGSPPVSGSPVRSLGSWLPYVPLLIAAVVVLYLAKQYVDRRSRGRPSESDPRAPETPPSAVPGPGAPAAAGAGVLPPPRPDRPTAAPPPTPATSASLAGPSARGSTGDVRSSSPPRMVTSGPIAPPQALYAARPSDPTPAARPRPSAPAAPPAVPASGPTASPGPGVRPAEPRTFATRPSGVATAGATTTPEGARTWPPSRIWDISPTPNSPKKPEGRRIPPDEP